MPLKKSLTLLSCLSKNAIILPKRPLTGFPSLSTVPVSLPKRMSYIPSSALPTRLASIADGASFNASILCRMTSNF